MKENLNNIFLVLILLLIKIQDAKTIQEINNSEDKFDEKGANKLDLVKHKKIMEIRTENIRRRYNKYYHGCKI